MKSHGRPNRKILLVHGDRQTGDLLVGRMASLRRKLLKPRILNPSILSMKNEVGATDTNSDYEIELVAPDAPFEWKIDPSVHVKESNRSSTNEETQENKLMRTWWYRIGDEYNGLQDSLEMLHKLWNTEDGFEGIFGFSRGSRLAHLVAYLHEASSGELFSNLKYVIMASGYGNVPMPKNFPPKGGFWDKFHYKDIYHLKVPSMHIMGAKDKLIPLAASKELLSSYVNPLVHEHDGGHHVPMRAADVRAILQFVDHVSRKEPVPEPTSYKKKNQVMVPDEEHARMQAEECDALAMIFVDEFRLLSQTNGLVLDDYDEEKIAYDHPIKFTIQLKPPPEQLERDLDSSKLWPLTDIALKVEYPVQYPDSIPIFSLHHDMNLLEFKLCQERACLNAIMETAEAEVGMPSVMSCIYRAREFFEQGGLISSLNDKKFEDNSEKRIGDGEIAAEPEKTTIREKDELGGTCTKMRAASTERVEKCIEEGLQIASAILNRRRVEPQNKRTNNICGAGGRWKYTIGLVGKPSAGKSTFFNAASAFARQRGGDEMDENGIAIGGATMAPHPFSTIDPNVGFCLVPAPLGSCPEDSNKVPKEKLGDVGCTHGRDSFGRRLIPVTLKDVAGLVPGAYKGRGRGNKVRTCISLLISFYRFNLLNDILLNSFSF